MVSKPSITYHDLRFLRVWSGILHFHITTNKWLLHSCTAPSWICSCIVICRIIASNFYRYTKWAILMGYDLAKISISNANIFFNHKHIYSLHTRTSYLTLKTNSKIYYFSLIFTHVNIHVLLYSYLNKYRFISAYLQQNAGINEMQYYIK